MVIASPRTAHPGRRAIAALLLALAVVGCASTSTRPRKVATVPGDPVSDTRLYVNPDTPAALQARVWSQDGQQANARAVRRIAAEPTAFWLTGASTDPGQAASIARLAARAGAQPVFVLYNVPDRDCHGLSAGGAANPGAYMAWVAAIARSIGGHRAIVILEPDAIDQSAGGCMSNAATARTTFHLLDGAVRTLKAHRGTRVYIDAGNAAWQPVGNLVEPLHAAGIDRADGFALNVSNFQTTSASIAYGRSLSRALGGRHFVIDTGRNGAGPAAGGMGSWCNPSGRALGTPPTTHTGVPLVDAYLWVKYPGESDGTCRAGQPAAGVWWPRYALGLADAAHR